MKVVNHTYIVTHCLIFLFIILRYFVFGFMRIYTFIMKALHTAEITFKIRQLQFMNVSWEKLHHDFNMEFPIGK